MAARTGRTAAAVDTIRHLVPHIRDHAKTFIWQFANGERSIDQHGSQRP